MSDFSVTLAVATHRDIKIRVWNTLWTLASCPNPKVSPCLVDGDALISRSRSRIATHFLQKTTDDYLFFLDDDVVISPQDARKLMLEAYNNKLPILGAPYATKSQEKSTFAIMTNENKGSFNFGKEGGLVSVKNVSTGCMLIAREVLEKMVKKETAHLVEQGYYSFFQHREGLIDGKWQDQSEDWFFCNEAKKLGFSIWMDSSIKLDHIGSFAYNFDYVKLLSDGGIKKHENVVLNYDLVNK